VDRIGGRIEVTENGHGPELHLVGEFDLANVEVLKDCLAAWVVQGHREAVVDLSETEFIDSTVIGTLVTAHVAGLVLTTRGATGAVRRALEVAAVGEVIKVED
jgi:anti-anti-sigma factor